MTTYIILVNWQNAKDTINCLESLDSLLIEGCHKVVVVDNDSSDGSLEQISDWAVSKFKGNLQFIKSTTNLGFAGANNLAIQQALADPSAEYIWLLNNDTIVEKHSLCELITHHKKNPGIGVCGSVLVYESDRSTIQAVGGTYSKLTGLTRHVLNGYHVSTIQRPDLKRKKIDYVVGASMLVSIEVVRNCGLMSEKYFLYGEDLDWCIRIRRFGLKVDWAPLSIVYHKEGGTTKTSPRVNRANRSIVIDTYALRSRLLVSMNFYPCLHIFVRSMFVVMGFKRICSGDVKGALRSIQMMLFCWR